MQRFVLLLVISCGHLLCGVALSDDTTIDQASQKVYAVVSLLELVIDADEATAGECLGVLTEAVQNGQLSKEEVDNIRAQLSEKLNAILKDESNPLRPQVALLTTAWRDAEGMRIARGQFASTDVTNGDRLAALDALVAAGDASVLPQVEAALADAGESNAEFLGGVMASLARLDKPDVPKIVLEVYPQLESELQPKAIEVLTQRPEWGLELLQAIRDGRIDKSVMNLNQLKRVALFKNEELQKLVTETYGAVRQEGRGDRQQVISRQRDFLRGTPGDAQRGVEAFKKVCGQCHKIYGEGAEVGPDITRNGRNNWEQLLQNVFDPSAVIGPGYQARVLVTADGRVLTGLPVEESDQRVVLTIQGGKLETIPRDQIDEYVVSEVSMMPEELEKQLTPQEIADLFAYLALDKPPGDETGRLLPGAPRQ